MRLGVLIWIFCLPLEAASFRVLEPDTVPAHFKSQSRVIAIGDLHGDWKALISILLDQGILNEKGKWIGGKSDVVIVGDWTGTKKKKTQKLVEYLIALEEMAERKGGRVHTLMGNFDRKGLNKWDFFSEEKEIAKWIVKRNALIKIDDVIYGHAGLDDWKNPSIKEVNSTLRAWLRYLVKDDKRPAESTRWVIDPQFVKRAGRRIQGPLWTRIYKIRDLYNDSRPRQGPTKKEFKRLLKKNGARLLVTAHNPTPDAKIHLEHPYYGKRLISIDTHISDRKFGNISSIEIERGRVLTRYTSQSAQCKEILAASQDGE